MIQINTSFLCLVFMLIILSNQSRQLPIDLEQTSLVLTTSPGTAVSTHTTSLLHSYSNPTTIISIGGLRFTSSTALQFYFSSLSISASIQTIQIRIVAPTILNSLRVNSLVFQQSAYTASTLENIIQVYPLSINVNLIASGYLNVYLGPITRSNFRLSDMPRCFFFLSGIAISGSDYFYESRCTFGFDKSQVQFQVQVGPTTTMGQVEGSMVILNQYQLMLVKGMYVGMEVVQVNLGISSATYIDTSVDTYIFAGLTSFTMLSPDQYYLDFTNNQASDIYPSTPINKIQLLQFSQFSCPLGTQINRATQACENRLYHQYITKPYSIRGLQLSRGKNYIALFSKFNVTIQKYDSGSNSYVQIQEIQPGLEIQSLAFSPQFGYMAVGTVYSDAIYAKIQGQNKYVMVYQGPNMLGNPGSGKSMAISENGQVIVSTVYDSVRGGSQAKIWKYNALHKTYIEYLEIPLSGNTVKMSDDGRFIIMNGQGLQTMYGLYDHNGNGFYKFVFKQQVSYGAIDITRDGQVLAYYYFQLSILIFHWNTTTHQFIQHHAKQAKYFYPQSKPLISISDNGLKMIIAANHYQKKYVIVYSRSDLDSEFQQIDTYYVGDIGVTNYFDAEISSDGSMFTVANDTQNVLIVRFQSDSSVQAEVIPSVGINNFHFTDAVNITETESQYTETINAVSAVALASVGINVVVGTFMVLCKCCQCKIPECSKIKEICEYLKIQAPEEMNIQANIEIGGQSSSKSEQKEKKVGEMILKEIVGIQFPDVKLFNSEKEDSRQSINQKQQKHRPKMKRRKPKIMPFFINQQQKTSQVIKQQDSHLQFENL